MQSTNGATATTARPVPARYEGLAREALSTLHREREDDPHAWFWPVIRVGAALTYAVLDVAKAIRETRE
jgi:hypothetical protein